MTKKARFFSIELLPAKRGSIIPSRNHNVHQISGSMWIHNLPKNFEKLLLQAMLWSQFLGDKMASFTSIFYPVESILTVSTTAKFFKMCTMLSRKNGLLRSLKAFCYRPPHDMHAARSWLGVIATPPLQSGPRSQ